MDQFAWDWLATTKSPWGFVLMLAIVIATFSGLFSKAAGDYFGMLGAASRWLRRRKEEAVDASTASTERRIARLEATVERLDKDVADLRAINEAHQDYEIYVASEWHRLELWAAIHGIELPPPPLMTFAEWAEKNPRDQSDNDNRSTNNGRTTT